MQASKFKAIRRKSRLTQAVLAFKLGLTQGAISFYESGRVKIPRNMSARLRTVGLLPHRKRA